MLTSGQITDVVERALLEDAPWGDVTTEALLAPDARVGATLVAREAGVMAGIGFFSATFRNIEQWTQVEAFVRDGERFDAGQVLGGVEGNARTVLRGERVALNILQRMCGIATTTAQYVDAISGTKARIVDTRKTTPGLRAIEKYAVRCGGGHNHRFSLSDAVLVKDNHLAALGVEGADITTALVTMKQSLPHNVHVEVEVDRIEQIEAVVDAGVDCIMFDNFSLEDMVLGVKLVDGRCLIEASGGVNIERVRAIAETGVDIISVGALTHSVRSLDLGLDMQAALR